jgi:MFS family permease
MTWAIGTVLGPIVGGALAQPSSWVLNVYESSLDKLTQVIEVYFLVESPIMRSVLYCHSALLDCKQSSGHFLGENEKNGLDRILSLYSFLNFMSNPHYLGKLLTTKYDKIMTLISIIGRDDVSLETLESFNASNTRELWYYNFYYLVSSRPGKGDFTK